MRIRPVQSDKNGKYTKTNGHTWKSPFSALCPGPFLATLRSFVLSFLPKFSQYAFLKTLRKTPLRKTLPSLNKPPSLLSFFGSLLRSLPQPPFLPPYHAVTSNDLPKAKPSALLQCCHLQRSLQQPHFLHHYNVVTSLLAAATFPSLSSAPLNGLRDPLPESSSTCQSLIVASKSEVDSL